MNILQQLLNATDKKFLLLDGAMGTNLFTRGLLSGDEPALWNETHPDKIQSVHQEAIAQGADIILTNSFGANPFRLKLHKAEDKVATLNEQAVANVRAAAAGEGRPILVAGDIGPSGELLFPLGAVSEEDAMAGFGQQLTALAAAKADLIWIETMSALEEVVAIVKAADKILGDKKNLVVSMTFDTNGKTMMGISPEKAVESLLTLSPNIIAFGINCGKSPAESVFSLWQWQRHLQQLISKNDKAPPEVPLLVAKANRGVPQYVDGQFIFDGTPAMMADYGRLAYALGARLIGGCCGTDGVALRAIKEGASAEASDPRYPDPNSIGIDTIETILGKIPANTLKHRH